MAVHNKIKNCIGLIVSIIKIFDETMYELVNRVQMPNANKLVLFVAEVYGD